MSETKQRVVIWLDDELGSEYEFALAPWKRALEQHLARAGARLVRCRNLEAFVEASKKFGAVPASGNRVALLIIDVMLNFEGCETFELLGFAKEKLIPLEAGARVAGLIRSSQFDAVRLPWLTELRETPMLILSASPQAPGWVRRNVGPSRMTNVEVVIKNLVRQSDGLAMQPAQDFFDVLSRLLM